MKSKFITSILVLSVLFLGCSKDDINDTPESINLNNNIANKTALIPAAEIQFTDSGDFEYMTDEKCGTGVSVHSIGFADVGKNEKFITEYYNCVSQKEGNSVEATFTDMEGDQLYFQSTKSGTDLSGNLEYKVIVVGGNGKYMNAYGELTITNVKTFETKEAGYYVNHVKGLLQY